MSEKNSIWNKLPQATEHYYLKYIVGFQSLTNKELVRELHQLATILEYTIFPPLQKIRQSSLIIKVSPQADGLFIEPALNGARQNISGTAKISSLLIRLGIHQVSLDTRLESNQISDSFKVLFHSAKKICDCEGGEVTAGYVCSAGNLAAVLLSKEGLNKFCANLRIDIEAQTFRISYSYCELFYSASVQNILAVFSKSRNHRAIFALAPKIGTFIGALFMLHHLFWSPFSVGGFIAATGGSLALGFGITYLVNTIASTIYDQEHRDRILKDNMREITALSHFPLHNPNPILKINHHGEVLFANKAAEDLAAKMNYTSEEVLEILPYNYKELVNQCLVEDVPNLEVVCARHERTIRYSLSPFPNERAVLLSGTDVTRMKELENKLLELNESLEKQVVERTKELQSTQDITILSLSALAETRDPDTGAHLQRTRGYVKLLAEYLRHSENYKTLDDDKLIDLLYRSAPLHDIGKVGIPDAILLKGNKLTSEEFEIMKQHPVIGGDSLQWAENKLGKNSFLQLAREIAYYHHEKWDGSGYPYGLVNDNIPISGRLMALADVYDALTTKRVYKEAYSHEKARTIILERKGTHFDPQVVEAFLSLENQFVEMSRRY